MRKARKGHPYSGQPHAQYEAGRHQPWIKSLLHSIPSNTALPLLCFSHADVLYSSNKLTSCLPQGLCSHHFTCLTNPSTDLHIAGSLSIQDPPQTSLPQRPLSIVLPYFLYSICLQSNCLFFAFCH